MFGLFAFASSAQDQAPPDGNGAEQADEAEADQADEAEGVEFDEEVFIPSEEIPADEEIIFPIDI
ncbi:MAG: hypothetical protein R3305_00880 [Gammaproteobacteria bacterium]|nr:hypothetical protein [Gammaproteobacteria bacterium]